MTQTQIYELGFSPKDLKVKPIEPMIPKNINCLYKVIEETKLHNLNTVVLWDTDTDGIFAGYTAYNSLIEILDEKDVYNYINKTKVHGITRQFINFCKEKNIKTVIIVDAGTNDINEIKELNELGITVIVIDHHEKTEEYINDKFILINSNDMEVGTNVSGAYITNEVMKSLHKHFLNKPLTEYDELAVISIVADICDRDEFNKNVILHFILGNFKETELIQLFRNKYTNNTIQFITSLTSKLNAILRYLGTEKTMELMLTNLTQLGNWVRDSNKIKELNDKIMSEIIQTSTIYEMSNVVILIITESSSRIGVNIRNYLGILASKLSKVKGKLCLVLASREVNFEVVDKDYKYCYSVRDVFNRNSLQVAIDCGIDANGHPSAWGGYLGETFANDIYNLNKSLSKSGIIETSSRVLETSNIINELTSLRDIIGQLSLWNSIQSEEDKIKIKFELDGNIRKTGKIKRINFGTYEFKSFEDKLSIGEYVYCVPEYNRTIDLLIKK